MSFNLCKKFILQQLYHLPPGGLDPVVAAYRKSVKLVSVSFGHSSRNILW